MGAVAYWIVVVGPVKLLKFAVVGYILIDLAERIFDRFYSMEEQQGEEWVCEYCGTEIYATTIEGFVEGLRIHKEAIYCPGDEDDDEGHY